MMPGGWSIGIWGSWFSVQWSGARCVPVCWICIIIHQRTSIVPILLMEKLRVKEIQHLTYIHPCWESSLRFSSPPPTSPELFALLSICPKQLEAVKKPHEFSWLAMEKYTVEGCKHLWETKKTPILYRELFFVLFLKKTLFSCHSVSFGVHKYLYVYTLCLSLSFTFICSLVNASFIERIPLRLSVRFSLFFLLKHF